MLLAMVGWPQKGSGSAVSSSPGLGASIVVNIVPTDLNRLHTLNLFPKGKVIWREIQNNYADSTLTANTQDK